MTRNYKNCDSNGCACTGECKIDLDCEEDLKDLLEELGEAEIIEADFEELCGECLNISLDHQIVACILDECKELLFQKGQSYNNGAIKMGDYYPRGIYSVVDVMHAKLLKIRSLLETDSPKREDIEDNIKDLVNFAGIFIGIYRGVIKTPANS